MSDHINWNPMDGSPPFVLTKAPAIDQLRANVTEAEAAYGRYVIPQHRNQIPSAHQQEIADAVYCAREALRKAEEEAKRPRLARPHDLARDVCGSGSGAWEAEHTRRVTLVQNRDEEWQTALRRLPRYAVSEHRQNGGSITSSAVLLSDIEALVQEAK